MTDSSSQPLLLGRKATACSFLDDSSDARKVLATRPSGVRGETVSTRQLHQDIMAKADVHGIFFPWNPTLRVWWYLTALGAVLTVFLAPYQVAFEPVPGMLEDRAGAMEKVLTGLFAVDILVHFNLAFYHENETIVFERHKIALAYLQGLFWVDFVGVFPFETVALLWVGELGSTNSTLALRLSLLRLLRLVRLRRMKTLNDELQYSPRISLLVFTLLRNFAVVLTVCHSQACIMYFLARLHGFDEDTWLGPMVYNMSGWDRYTTSLYWSITTFTTVGYGDFSPVNSSEQIAGSLFMLVNVVLAAWIIGSITLLVVKGDESTGEYSDSLETLHQYGTMHNFDAAFMNKLQQQLGLEFNNRQIADEQVLKNFPSAVRRKILRRLYLEDLVRSGLMHQVRPQFVDAFLTSCTVEIFSPGEEIVERGSILSDLFLLVGGIAEVVNSNSNAAATDRQRLEAGDFVGEIGFFTESPQVDSVVSLTVCKTLTMSQSAYKLLAQDHPGSVGKILQNLLAKVQTMALQVNLPQPLPILRLGSSFDVEEGYGSLQSTAATAARDGATTVNPETESIFRTRHQSLTAVEELIKLHMERQIDDQTTRLLFAASRGDTKTIALMCDNGFDPNHADYDDRTALMVASMKGNTDAAKLLLEYKADPNKTDMHGSSALLEAVKNGHQATMDLLFSYAADLCLPENLAASILCQAVFDGDVLLLQRLIKAGIDVDAADYDKRTAAHIAGAEGNVAAVRVLAQSGADLAKTDRWGNTVAKEAKRSNARRLLAFLDELEKEKA